MDKIKLVVISENTLAYLIPGRPTMAGVLRASVLLGSNCKDGDITLVTGKSVRLAHRSDFEIFRVCFDGYNNSAQYEFQQ